MALVAGNILELAVVSDQSFHFFPLPAMLEEELNSHRIATKHLRLNLIAFMEGNAVSSLSTNAIAFIWFGILAGSG